MVCVNVELSRANVVEQRRVFKIKGHLVISTELLTIKRNDHRRPVVFKSCLRDAARAKRGAGRSAA